MVPRSGAHEIRSHKTSNAQKLNYLSQNLLWKVISTILGITPLIPGKTSLEMQVWEAVHEPLTREHT
jgi:hypothetical protein